MFFPMQPLNLPTKFNPTRFFPMNPSISPILPSYNEVIMDPQISIYQEKLLNFFNKNGECRHHVNMEIIKKYYHLPFDALPAKEEIMQILEKIVQRATSNQSLKKNWYKEDLKLLTWLCVQQSFAKLLDIKNFKTSDWQAISEIVPYKSAVQCKYKWFSLERMNLQRKPWTIEEDKILKEIIVEKQNFKWNQIAETLFVRTGETLYRAGKFCRERWNNYLCPSIKKGLWSVSEDIELLSKVPEKTKKWCEIAREIGGRTENGVKNRFNSLMKKWNKAKKYKETVQESTKINELRDYFVGKAKNESQNQQRNNNLLLKIKKLNAFSLKKTHHFKEIVEQNANNLLFELMESDIQRKNQQIPTKSEPKPQKLVKTEANGSENANFYANFTVKTESFQQIPQKVTHYCTNSMFSPMFLGNPQVFQVQSPQINQNFALSTNFGRSFPVFPTFVMKSTNNYNNFNSFNYFC